MSTENDSLRESEVEIIESNELLLRQIHPGMMDGDQVSKQAFYPSSSDEGELSVNRECIVTAKDVYDFYTQELGLQSIGVQAVTVREVLEVGEATGHRLRVVDDSRTPRAASPAHAYVDFKQVEARKRREKIGSLLRDLAMARGWQYRP